MFWLFGEFENNVNFIDGFICLSFFCNLLLFLDKFVVWYSNLFSCWYCFDDGFKVVVYFMYFFLIIFGILFENVVKYFSNFFCDFNFLLLCWFFLNFFNVFDIDLIDVWCN